jgi:hypothetical protein
MPHPTSPSTPNISTRPTPASRSVKSTPRLPARQLCVFERPPVLLNGPYMPDINLQSNGLAILRHPPKSTIGLGLGLIDSMRSRIPNQLPAPTVFKRTALRNRPYQTRSSSSFDCEKSLASMKIEESPTPLYTGTDLVFPSIADKELSFTPKIDSLYDLDVQYPSSRSLNKPSPELSPKYSYSPHRLSPSWSFGPDLSTPFSSPTETLPASSSDIHLLPASWSSSSNDFLPRRVLKAESSPQLFLRTPDMAIPLVDINMFQDYASSQGSTSSIDPAYLTAPLDFPPLPYDEADSNPTRFGCDHSPMLIVKTSPPKPQIRHDDYDVAFAASSVMIQHARALSRPRIIKRKSSTQDVSRTVNQECAHPIVPGTPILDAHRGIGQGELEVKARRYQQRNPRVEAFDKQWLASFSGKLSDKGEMIKDFRCYVVGCTQVNKRQDHMIVHVGSHLDQRPFKCDKWRVYLSHSTTTRANLLHSPAGFLRKNELKRHEQSHDLSRPFACPHCKASFKRQDLCVRHLKNKHHKEPENKENSRPSKKAKIL